MVTGLIGKKVGMTQVFEADGTVHPATVIKAGPCVVVQAKTASTDGTSRCNLVWWRNGPPKSVSLWLDTTRKRRFRLPGCGAK